MSVLWSGTIIVPDVCPVKPVAHRSRFSDGMTNDARGSGQEKKQILSGKSPHQAKTVN